MITIEWRKLGEDAKITIFTLILLVIDTVTFYGNKPTPLVGRYEYDMRAMAVTGQ